MIENYKILNHQEQFISSSTDSYGIYYSIQQTFRRFPFHYFLYFISNQAVSKHTTLTLYQLLQAELQAVLHGCFIFKLTKSLSTSLLKILVCMIYYDR